MALRRAAPGRLRSLPRRLPGRPGSASGTRERDSLRPAPRPAFDTKLERAAETEQDGRGRAETAARPRRRLVRPRPSARISPYARLSGHVSIAWHGDVARCAKARAPTAAAEIDMADAFGARSTLKLQRRALRDLPAGAAASSECDVARLPYTLRRSCSRTCCATRTASDAGERARRSPTWAPEPSRRARSRSRRRASSDAGLHRACPRSSTSPRCATRWRDLGGDPAQINPLIPAELVIDHLGAGRRLRRPAMAFARNAESASSSATASATPSCAGASRAFRRPQASSRRTPASSTRSTSSTSRACRRDDARARGASRTRSSAPTRTRRWSTASACSAGASAGSRPRPRCSASRSRCSSRRWSASGSTGALPEGATATDLVLTVTADPAASRRRRQVRRVLRRRRLAGLAARRPRDDRRTCRPSTGRRAGFFPVDDETLHVPAR